MADTSAPAAAIAAPANGGTYVVNQALASSFSCTEGAGGPGISSCTDQYGRPSGAAIDTSTPGTYTFTVTAQSADGLSSSSSVTYTVVLPAPPRIFLPLPTSRAVYAQGQAINSFFLCADGTGGPGLSSCVDQNGQASGAPIDTSTLGSRAFTVTATSEDGQVSSATIHYRVVPAPVVSHVVAHRGGVVTLQVTLYGPGTIDVLSSADFRSFALAADVVQPPNGSFVFGSAHLVSDRPQTLQVRVSLSQAGKLLLVNHRRATLQLSVVYTGTRGQPDLVKSLILRVRR